MRVQYNKFLVVYSMWQQMIYNVSHGGFFPSNSSLSCFFKTLHLERESPASFSLTVRAAANISPPSSAMQHRWHQIPCLKSSFTLMLQPPGRGKAAALLVSVCLWTLKSYLCPPADSHLLALYSRSRLEVMNTPLSPPN